MNGYPRGSFVEGLAEATGLDKTIVDVIVRDMTLNPRRFHCSITSTPFVESRSGTLFILPRLFAFLEPERTVATVLTTGSGRDAYDEISTILERTRVSQIAAWLRNRGFRVTAGETLTTVTGEKITPDFIISDGESDQVVVADYKNALAATAVAAVTNRLKEYRKGVQQVSNYLAALEREPEMARRHHPWLPNRPKYSGLLVFRVPMPLPIQCGSRVVVDNWFSLSNRLTACRQPATSNLLNCKAVTAESLVWQHTDSDICVGDWKYRRSMLVGLPRVAMSVPGSEEGIAQPHGSQR